MATETFLDFSQSRHSAYIHGYGRTGTHNLIQQLQLKGDEKVVEIGCGTGATLVEMKKHFPSISLTGIDASMKMLERTTQRLRFCGLSSEINVFHTDKKNLIEKKSIDLVYLESVLVIQEGDILSDTLKYILSILKPNGKLVFNETIWLRSIEKQQVNFFNQKAKKHFGIIQCREEFHGKEKSIQFIQKNGFKVNHIDTIKPIPISFLQKCNRSTLFNYWGRLKNLLSPASFQKNKEYQDIMSTFFETNQQCLDAYLFVCSPQ